MTWLNNGNLLQIDTEDPDKPISIVSNEIDDDFIKLATEYGQIFNILLEDPLKDPLKVREACNKYSDIVKETQNESSDFCFLCYNLIKLCFFTPLNKNIRDQISKLIKYVRPQSNDNILIELVCDLFESPDNFQGKYIKNGGSESISNHITSYYEIETTEKWISQINQEYQNSSTQFDTEFCKFIDQRIIKCDSYLLSILLSNFINHKKTTPQNLLDTAQEITLSLGITARSFEPSSLDNKIFWGLLNDKFSVSAKYIYLKTNDIIFAVHFIHLLSLKNEKEDLDLKNELDTAILRYTEFILSDYDEEDEDSGLRKWVPSYLRIVSDDILPTIQRVLPAIQSGLQGPFIDKVKKLPKFVYDDSSENLQLFHNIKELVNKLSSSDYESEEIDSFDNDNGSLKQIVRMLNESYIKCNDKMKSEILLQIIPFLEKFDGLSGSVISCMIDIGNAYTVFKDNDPCPSLQKMLYDIIFETGDVPEYVLK